MGKHYDSFTFTHKGRQFEARLHVDHCGEAPWDMSDGHGVVTEQVSRDKRPGEWVLSSGHGYKRFYDAADTMHIAKHDGWGLGDDQKAALLQRLCAPKRMAKTVAETVQNGQRRRVVTEWETRATRSPDVPLTAGEIRAEAVRLDFEFLRGWCNDEWHYCGVCVVTLDDEGEPIGDEFEHAVWGIESDADGYHREVAAELADEICAELEASAKEEQTHADKIKAARDKLDEMAEWGSIHTDHLDVLRAGLDAAEGV